MRVAFDCDGTLIDLKNKPRHEVIDLFRALEALGAEMIIWSGGGVEYAERVRDRLGLEARVIPKGTIVVDIAVDDQTVNLGLANILVSEGEW